jgi:hypothetical protein
VPSYVHKKLIDQIAQLDAVPADAPAFSAWIEAGAHLQFLKDNGRRDEIVFYASGPYAFIHSMVVPNRLLTPPDEHDLLGWSCSPVTSIASFCTGGGREGMWIERRPFTSGSQTLKQGTNLLFGRTFEGWSGPDRAYFEVNQEYTHLTGIHWRPEERAYCKYGDNGDIAHIVSVTRRQGDDGVSLVSFNWRALEEYLAAADASLVRMYDFTLLRRESFQSWPDGPETVITNEPDFFYRQKVCPGFAAYTRGVQILRCRENPADILKNVSDGWMGKEKRRYAAFIAKDWRNKRITQISTDPTATTNYFETKDNDLPFELSPAFFRPEVLLKYKGDRDKYTVEDRSITCRTAWYLKGYDVNDAGQVHAYICDLRNLPYTEQLHWLSFNEAPKGGISERAYINDFEGQFTKTMKPLEKVVSILQDWDKRAVPWWTLRGPDLLDRVTVPYSPSRDEWAESFLDLSKLVNEGFEVKAIRKKLDAVGAAYDDKKDQSIVLMEKLRDHLGGAPQGYLAGLRIAQKIRSKVKGHSGGGEALAITQQALEAHETFSRHFEAVCDQIATELTAIEVLFQDSSAMASES